MEAILSLKRLSRWLALAEATLGRSELDKTAELVEVEDGLNGILCGSTGYLIGSGYLGARV